MAAQSRCIRFRWRPLLCYAAPSETSSTPIEPKVRGSEGWSIVGAWRRSAAARRSSAAKWVGSRSSVGWLDLPAPDQAPKHEDQLPEKRDEDESKMGVRIRVWPQAIDHPAQSIDCHQNPDYSREVARPVSQGAQQTQRNSENHKGKRVIGIGIRKQRERLEFKSIPSLSSPEASQWSPKPCKSWFEFIVERAG